MKEYLTQKKLRLTLQIFASDLDDRAIEAARAGLYPVGIAGDLTPARLQRFFTKEDSSYRVKKEIRDLVVFATHNILTDAPFTKLDLLSCRNLLIYLDAQAQHKILPLFHYALKPNGILFLGTSETVGEFEQLFTVIDRKWKLFRRTEEPGTFPRLERFPGGLMKEMAEARAHLADLLLPMVKAAGLGGWRKCQEWRRKLKGQMIGLTRLVSSGGPHKEQRKQAAAEAYVRDSYRFEEKVFTTIQALPSRRTRWHGRDASSWTISTPG